MDVKDWSGRGAYITDLQLWEFDYNLFDTCWVQWHHMIGE